MLDINGRIDCSFKPQTPSKSKEQGGAATRSRSRGAEPTDPHDGRANGRRSAAAQRRARRVTDGPGQRPPAQDVTVSLSGSEIRRTSDMQGAAMDTAARYMRIQC